MPLDPCGNPDQQDPVELDNAPDRCQPTPSLKDPGGILDEKCNTAYGREANSCDPMQIGSIVEDMRKPANRQVIYKNWRAIYGVNEAVTDLFRDLAVIDVNGEAQGVPIMWGTQERAVAAIIQANVQQDSSLVVQRVKLPMLAIHYSDLTPNYDRYIYHGAIDYLRDFRADGKPGLTEDENGLERSTIFGVARGIPLDVGYQLTAWTLYLEDMDQILEQILRKFSPVAYIRVQGVHNWETIVKLESIASNIEMEPGDQAQRVVKFQFGLKAETFIPQPIVRKKAVLKTKVDMVDAVSDEEITRVITRIEEAIKGL
jgi:hypothetical protein